MSKGISALNPCAAGKIFTVKNVEQSLNIKTAFDKKFILFTEKSLPLNFRTKHFKTFALDVISYNDVIEVKAV